MTDKRLEVHHKYFTSSFKADIYNISRAVNGALAYYDKSFDRMDEATRMELKVVLNELLVNAVKHGGKSGACGLIKAIAGMATEDCAFLIVEDDGEGYDTDGLNKFHTDALVEGRIEEVEETGRGIFIVKCLCEDFMVNEKGNKVVIIKKLRKASGE